MSKTNESEAAAAAKAESSFTKEQLIASERFRGRRDIINALLSHDKQYAVRDAEKMIDTYMKGKVK